MKKILGFVSVLLFIVILTACGNNEDVNSDASNNNDQNVETVNNNTEENENDNGNDADEASSSSADDVIAEILKANESIESFAAVAEVDQDMEIGGEVMSTSTSSDMRFVLDPVGLHQKMTMDIPGEGVQEIETYMTEDGYYMYEPSQDMWMKFPDSMSGQLVEQVMTQADVEAQLEQFKGMEDNFSLEEDDDLYILKFATKGDELGDQMSELVEGTLPDELASLGASLLENMSINQLKYEMKVDKSTYYPESLDMVIDFTMGMDDQEMHSKQNMKTTYSDYNSIDEITVPQDVIDNAEEMDY